MERLLVTGASGYLGERLVALAAELAEVIGARRTTPAPAPAIDAVVDLADPSAVEDCIHRFRPAAVINAGAVNPGGSEALMDPVNHRGAAAVAEAAERSGARLVHVSIDVVVGGDHAPYDDGAPTDPSGTYAVSKAAGERAVTDACPSAAIVRTSLIYGLHAVDRSTAGFLERIASGDTVGLFSDVIRQPVEVESLARVLIALALEDTDVSGHLNVVGAQASTREHIGRRLLAHWGAPLDRVEAVLAADLAPATPRDLRLRTDRAAALGYELPGFDEVVRPRAG